jgi:hypothetical protein
VRCRARRRADAAVQATVEFVVKPEVGLDVLKNFLKLVTFNGRRIRYRIANMFLYSGR